MFVEFFLHMKGRGLKVSLTEWMSMMDALRMGLAGESLTRFYHLCRAVCVKTEAHFDLYDQCFVEFFADAEVPAGLEDAVLDWLANPILPRELNSEELARLKELSLDELREQFEQRLREQTEAHNGGSKWVGTGGTSPFGHSGVHPSGVRVGGASRLRSAMQVASDRRFRNLRHDRKLDVRQIAVALRQLRRLSREGRADELDVDATIDATARNAGDLDLIFRPERKNAVKLLLLMDVGGSMTPYTRLSERLFSAAHAATHFKAFRHYFFHNCPYERLFTDISRHRSEATAEVLADLDRTWFVVLVGDAAMHPYELMAPGGSIDYYHHNAEAGLVWLNRIAERCPRSVWLNPDPPAYWEIPTNRRIRTLFEMFPLTVDGLERAVTHLRHQAV